jgi:4-diphosphocytidyl-2-C-methyl-D-erythritol kinase
VSQQQIVSVFSPAKINLFLAVTGRRADGYHELVSVVAPLTFGDELTVEIGEGRPETGRQFSLQCDDPQVPVDGSNLVLKAAEAFATATGWKSAAKFRLAKRVPVGAGLGGGSSNATAALRALNQLSGARLSHAALMALAAGVGSDCPLFLSGGPVVIRGRGEQVEALPSAAARRLHGRSVLLFKPGFGVSTAWAYEQMVAGAPRAYLSAAEAGRRLAAWIEGQADAAELLFNNLEPVVFRKYLALPVLLERLRVRFGLAPRMSGSGSACFVLLPAGANVEEISAAIVEAWGQVSFVQIAAIA